ncbi:hypothetical protein GCM10023341_19710 [Ornithinimicrobium tianjinense]
MAWRQLATDPVVSVGLALLVAVVSFLLTAAPRALEDVNGRQLSQDLSELSAQQRDVTGGWGTTVELPVGTEEDPGRVDDPWAPFREGAERIRADQPEPLRSLLAPAQMFTRGTTRLGHVPSVESGYYEAQITLYADPDLQDLVDVVAGEWPASALPGGPGGGGTATDGSPARRGPDLPMGQFLPVLVLDQAAEEMHWEVGDELAGSLRISGLYRPKDPDDPRWQHVDNGTTMGVLADPNKGEMGTVTAYLNPLSRGYIGQPTSVRTEVWYPVSVEGVSAAGLDTTLLRRQLTGMIAEQHVLVEQGDPALGYLEGDQIPSFTTGLTGVLDQTVRQQRATASLLAVVAAGPLGVAVAVTLLAARLVVQRRRPTLALVLARGASPTQLRWLVAAEGALLGVPAALLGHLAAVQVLPGGSRWWEWLVTAVVGAAPALALAVTLEDASLLQERRDLTASSRSRWRWVAEVGVVVLAALATWRLLDRGTRGDAASGSGVDLLGAAAPVLLALAACVVVLRLYPLPLGTLTRTLRSRRGLTSFLGAARALRDPTAGLVPTLAVVLGTTIALVSAVLLTTVTRGAEAVAWETNGADVRVRGPVFTGELVAQLEQVDGVEDVARLRDVGTTVELGTAEERTSVRIVLADHELQQVLPPGSLPLAPPASLYADAGILPVVAGGQTPATLGPGSLRPVGQVEVVGHLRTVPGFDPGGAWVLMDAARWEAAGRTTPLARTALLSVSEGADPETVARSVEAVVGSAVVTTVQAELDDFTTSPVVVGLTRAFVGATLLTGLLTVLAVVVVQLMGTDARGRLLAVLRTLGLEPRQTRALTAWELGPMLVMSLLVGGLLGLAVSWVLSRGLDLTGLTGGRVQPQLAVDPLLTGAVLGAVVLTVLLAITVSAWLAGRTNLAQALRVGEER